MQNSFYLVKVTLVLVAVDRHFMLSLSFLTTLNSVIKIFNWEKKTLGFIVCVSGGCGSS